MGAQTPLPMDFAVRLADEGVPLRAIARACRLPSEDLRQTLWEAKNDGRLISLPVDEWPAGFPREPLTLELSRVDRDVLIRSMCHIFKVTVTPARLLLALLQCSMVPRTRTDVGGRAMDVHVHSLRKALAVMSFKLETLWGYGYRLSVPDRRRAIEIILRHVAASA